MPAAGRVTRSLSSVLSAADIIFFDNSIGLFGGNTPELPWYDTSIFRLHWRTLPAPECRSAGPHGHNAGSVVEYKAGLHAPLVRTDRFKRIVPFPRAV